MSRNVTAEIVLDASALLALLNDEPGADVVASSLDRSVMCTVNHSEVVAKLAELGMPEAAIEEALALPIRIVDFDTALSMRAGLLRPATRALGLSLGDRACLALGAHLGVEVMTAESSWTEVSGGPPVRLIRSTTPPARRKRRRT